MSYVGKWTFHSIGTVTDSDEMVYLCAEDYLKSVFSSAESCA